MSRPEKREDVILGSLLIVATRNKGYHLYYRCSEIQGNQALAKRPASESEREKNPNERVKVLIETRGQGGYVVAPPSPGYAISRGSFQNIPTITPADRAKLLAICRGFNEVIQTDPPVTKPISKPATVEGISPFEDFDINGDVPGLLEKHGWTRVAEKDGRIHFKRPGDTDSKTSGDFHIEKRIWKVFTTSSEFDSEKGYNPTQVFALLECGNDLSKASHELYKAGYGARKARQTKRSAGFWEVSSQNKISILRVPLISFLTQNGFGQYFLDRKTSILARMLEGIFEEITAVDITQFIDRHISSLPETFDGITRGDLREVFYRGIDTYSSKVFLSLLPKLEPDFLNDTRDFAYFPFQNGIIEIGKGGICRKVSLQQLGKVIWRSHTKDFNVTLDPEYNLVDGGNYAEFIRKISADDHKRMEYAMSLIG